MHGYLQRIRLCKAEYQASSHLSAYMLSNYYTLILQFTTLLTEAASDLRALKCVQTSTHRHTHFSHGRLRGKDAKNVVTSLIPNPNCH